MATYPTPAQIDEAVPVDGIPDRAKTNAILRAVSQPPTYAQVTGKPSTFAPTIGTTATTAAAGNHTHAAASATASGFMTAAQFTKLANLVPFKLASAAPAAPDSPGTQWEIFVDGQDVLYICIATDTWRTVQLTSWS